MLHKLKANSESSKISLCFYVKLSGKVTFYASMVNKTFPKKNDTHSQPTTYRVLRH